MQFHAIAIALFSAILAARATPVANPNHDAACNKDWSPDACGACHYWRQCLDSRTDEWISPWYVLALLYRDLELMVLA